MAWMWPLAAVALGVALLLGSRSSEPTRSTDELRPPEEDSSRR
jgi:hypothetical protein